MSAPWEIAKFTGRFVSGRPLDGRPRGDSRFLHPATSTRHGHAVVSEWQSRPGWERAAIRLGSLTAALVALWVCLVAGPVVLAAVEVTTAGAVCSCALYYGWRLLVLAQEWHLHRRYVGPLHARLTSSLGLPYRTAGEYLTVPADYRAPDGPGVRVELPAGRAFTADEKATLVAIVTSTLGLSDADHAFTEEGNRPHLLVFPAPRPPARLALEDVLSEIRTASPTAPILGKGAKGSTIASDLNADSPHILVSAGSGGGKSVLTKLVAAQALRHGCELVILDFKRISHTWAQDLPGVTYCKGIDQIHDRLVALGIEGDRRNLAVDAGDDPGPRIVIVAEEMNATITKLTQYWEAIRDPKAGDPKRSPAVAGLGDVLFMGRAVRMHVVAIAQMMTARTLGGPEARENFATRCLTRYSVNAWKMLAPETPYRKRSRVVGRWQVVMAGEAHECQVPYLSDEEARALALEAATAAPESAVAVPDQAGDPGTVPAGTDELVTLREAVERGLLTDGLTLDAVRRASTRDGFPAPARVLPTGNRYRTGELNAWCRAREGRKQLSMAKGS